MNPDTPVTKVSQVSPDLIRKYIDGCHILHYHNLIDAYGHLSVRLSASTFLMARYMAPALVASPDDLVVYKTEDGEPVDPNAPRGFSERFIHSEIYKAYPDVQATVHSHSLAVIPFSISSQPLAACFHMAGFLGCRVPVWDADSVYTDEDIQSMLIRSTRLGASLAKALGGAGEGGRGEPQHPVVLMRGHGMVVTAERIEMVVLRCYFTAHNAQVQQSAMALGGTVKLFTEREARDAGATSAAGAVKPWALWKREVENSTLYQNLA